jgi:hypothetical protein
MLSFAEEPVADTRGIGGTDKWSSSSSHGVDWAFRGSLLREV